ncbi:MAG: DUF1983 domain-containing protein [Ruminococcus sp.]|nr:DUF1983 domain-containing protein [Ruminococcus sp.]
MSATSTTDITCSVNGTPIGSGIAISAETQSNAVQSAICTIARVVIFVLASITSTSILFCVDNIIPHYSATVNAFIPL